MNILITGGCGFIGSNFVRYMLEEHPEHKIINLDKLTYAGNLENLADVADNPNYAFVKADICDRSAVDGVSLPLGWLCTRISPVALCFNAPSRTFRG